MRSTAIDFPGVNAKLNGTVVKATNNLTGEESFLYFDAEQMQEYAGGHLPLNRAVDLLDDDAADQLPDEEREDVMGYVENEDVSTGNMQSENDSMSDPNRLIDFEEKETVLDYNDLQKVTREFDGIGGNDSTEEIIDGLDDEPDEEVAEAIRTHADNSPPPDPGDSV